MAETLAESSPLIEHDGEEKVDLTAEKLLYAVHSFCAVLRPVSLTMVLASLVSTTFQTGVSSHSMSAYTVYDTSQGSSDSVVHVVLVPTACSNICIQLRQVRLGKSIANSLVIVTFLAAATFLIVGLYKFR